MEIAVVADMENMLCWRIDLVRSPFLLIINACPNEKVYDHAIYKHFSTTIGLLVMMLCPCLYAVSERFEILAPWATQTYMLFAAWLVWRLEILTCYTGN